MSEASQVIKVFKGHRIADIVKVIDQWLDDGDLEAIHESMCAEFIRGPLIVVTVTACTGGQGTSRYFGVQGSESVVNAALDDSQAGRHSRSTTTAMSGWDIILLVRYEPILQSAANSTDIEAGLPASAPI